MDAAELSETVITEELGGRAGGWRAAGLGDAIAIEDEAVAGAELGAVQLKGEVFDYAEHGAAADG